MPLLIVTAAYGAIANKGKNMAKYIPSGTIVVVGLENYGYSFLEDCKAFCVKMLGDLNSETVMQIYHECVSQIIYHYTDDSRTFLLNVLELPNFKTITYTEAPLDLETIKWFKGRVRLFAIVIYNLISSQVQMQLMSTFYTLESSTTTMLLLKRYDNGYMVTDIISGDAPYDL